MDEVKQAQLKNVKVWCRRFGVEFNEARAVRAIESASKYPGLSGSTRRLPLALVFSKKIGEAFPQASLETKQFLAYIFAVVMADKVYHGLNTPWEQAVEAELRHQYGGEKGSVIMTKSQPAITMAGKWFADAAAVREREYGSLGAMLSRALRNPQLMED